MLFQLFSYFLNIVYTAKLFNDLEQFPEMADTARKELISVYCHVSVFRFNINVFHVITPKSFSRFRAKSIYH